MADSKPAAGCASHECSREHCSSSADPGCKPVASDGVQHQGQGHLAADREPDSASDASDPDEKQTASDSEPGSTTDAMDIGSQLAALVHGGQPVAALLADMQRAPPVEPCWRIASPTDSPESERSVLGSAPPPMHPCASTPAAPGTAISPCKTPDWSKLGDLLSQVGVGCSSAPSPVPQPPVSCKLGPAGNDAQLTALMAPLVQAGLLKPAAPTPSVPDAWKPSTQPGPVVLCAPLLLVPASQHLEARYPRLIPPRCVPPPRPPPTPPPPTLQAQARGMGAGAICKPDVAVVAERSAAKHYQLKRATPLAPSEQQPPDYGLRVTAPGLTTASQKAAPSARTGSSAPAARSPQLPKVLQPATSGPSKVAVGQLPRQRSATSVQQTVKKRAFAVSDTSARSTRAAAASPRQEGHCKPPAVCSVVAGTAAVHASPTPVHCGNTAKRAKTASAAPAQGGSELVTTPAGKLSAVPAQSIKAQALAPRALRAGSPRTMSIKQSSMTPPPFPPSTHCKAPAVAGTAKQPSAQMASRNPLLRQPVPSAAATGAKAASPAIAARIYSTSKASSGAASAARPLSKPLPQHGVSVPSASERRQPAATRSQLLTEDATTSAAARPQSAPSKPRSPPASGAPAKAQPCKEHPAGCRTTSAGNAAALKRKALPAVALPSPASRGRLQAGVGSRDAAECFHQRSATVAAPSASNTSNRSSPPAHAVAGQAHPGVRRSPSRAADLAGEGSHHHEGHGKSGVQGAQLNQQAPTPPASKQDNLAASAGSEAGMLGLLQLMASACPAPASAAATKPLSAASLPHRSPGNRGQPSAAPSPSVQANASAPKGQGNGLKREPVAVIPAVSSAQQGQPVGPPPPLPRQDARSCIKPAAPSYSCNLSLHPGSIKKHGSAQSSALPQARTGAPGLQEHRQRARTCSPDEVSLQPGKRAAVSPQLSTVAKRAKTACQRTPSEAIAAPATTTALSASSNGDACMQNSSSPCLPAAKPSKPAAAIFRACSNGMSTRAAARDDKSIEIRASASQQTHAAATSTVSRPHAAPHANSALGLAAAASARANAEKDAGLVQAAAAGSIFLPKRTALVEAAGRGAVPKASQRKGVAAGLLMGSKALPDGKREVMLSEAPPPSKGRRRAPLQLPSTKNSRVAAFMQSSASARSGKRRESDMAAERSLRVIEQRERFGNVAGDFERIMAFQRAEKAAANKETASSELGHART